MRNPNVIAALVLSASMLVSAVVFAASFGRYTMSDRPDGGAWSVYILDRLTGKVRRCTFRDCVILSDREGP